MSVSPIVHGGGIAHAASVYGGRPEDWLDLSTGINPRPCAVPPIPADAWHRLPDAHLLEAACKAAARYYRSGDSVPLAVPGTQSAIQCLPRLVDERRPVAILGPTYGEYGRVLRQAGLTVDDITALDEVRPAHGLAVIVNPNNPTGRAFAASEVLALARRQNDSGGLVLVDEAFGDMQPELSVTPFVSTYDNLIVFRSFGKFFGLAGLRLGFVVARADRLAAIANALGPWSVSGPALVMAEAMLSSDTSSIAAQVAVRKTALDRILQAAGLNIVGETPLFTLVATPQAGRLHERLCGAFILTRAFSYAPDWLRIGLTPDVVSDQRLAAALEHATS